LKYEQNIERKREAAVAGAAHGSAADFRTAITQRTTNRNRDVQDVWTTRDARIQRALWKQLALPKWTSDANHVAAERPSSSATGRERQKRMNNATTHEPQKPGQFARAHGYAAFIDRGRGWEQCTCEMSRDTARIYVRGRRQQEKAYPMGKRFKTDRAKRHNAPHELPARKPDA
jgi:hypothetical protein